MKQNMKVHFFVPYTILTKFLKYQEKSHTIIVYGNGTAGSLTSWYFHKKICCIGKWNDS